MLTINQRPAIWADTITIAKDFWLTGTGLNTYGVSTLFYQTSVPGQHLREAHNDYLQLAAEGGLLLGVPILLTVVAFAWEVRRRLRGDAGFGLTTARSLRACYNPVEMHPIYDTLVEAVRDACQRHYGARLVSVAVFGSVGRGTPGPDSDIDLLVVAEQLPRGRLPRSDDFAAVERALATELTSAHRHGLHPTLSPIFKTPDEVAAGSPLFLDMLDDARILYDRDGFLQHAFQAFAARLARLGAKRIWRDETWHWDLKPDYQPGEIFEI